MDWLQIKVLSHLREDFLVGDDGIDAGGEY